MELVAKKGLLCAMRENAQFYCAKNPEFLLKVLTLICAERRENEACTKVDF